MGNRVVKAKISDSQSQSFGVTPYIVGFVTALVLTLIAYVITTNHLLSGAPLVVAIMGLALVQLIVQLVFFLHFGRKKTAPWHGAAFYFMLIILVIIVGGSLWIMANLNYHMTMSPHQMDEYMLEQSSKGF